MKAHYTMPFRIDLPLAAFALHPITAAVIADALTVRGIRVADVIGGSRAEIHKITSFARVRGDCILFPSATDEIVKPARAKESQKEKRLAGER